MDDHASQAPHLSIADLDKQQPRAAAALRDLAEELCGPEYDPAAVQVHHLVRQWNVLQQYLLQRTAYRVPSEPTLSAFSAQDYAAAMLCALHQPEVKAQLDQQELQQLQQQMEADRRAWSLAANRAAGNRRITAAAVVNGRLVVQETSGPSDDQHAGISAQADAAAVERPIRRLRPRVVGSRATGSIVAAGGIAMQKGQHAHQRRKQADPRHQQQQHQDAGQLLSEARLEPTLVTEQFDSALPQLSPAARKQPPAKAGGTTQAGTQHTSAAAAAAAPDGQAGSVFAAQAVGPAGQGPSADQPQALSVADVCAFFPQKYDAGAWLLRVWAKLVFGDTAKPGAIQLTQLVPHWGVLEQYLEDRAAGRVAGQERLAEPTVRAYVRAVQRVFEQPNVLQQLHSCGLQQLTERIAATKARYRWSGGSRAKQRRVAAPAAVTRWQRAAAAAMCDDDTEALRGDNSSSSSSSGSDSDSNGGDDAAAAALSLAELLPLVRKAQAELQHDEGMPHSSSMPSEAAAAASDVPSLSPAAMPLAAAAANRSAVLLPAQQHQQQQALQQQQLQQQHAAGRAVEGDVATATQLPTAGETPDPQPQRSMTLTELISRTSNTEVVGQLRQWARLVFGQEVDAGSVRVSELLQHWSVYDRNLQQKIAWGPDGSPPAVKQETTQHYTWSLSRTLRVPQVQAQLSSQLQQQLAQQIEETKHRLRGHAPQAGAAVATAGQPDENAGVIDVTCDTSADILEGAAAEPAAGGGGDAADSATQGQHQTAQPPSELPQTTRPPGRPLVQAHPMATHLSGYSADWYVDVVVTGPQRARRSSQVQKVSMQAGGRDRQQGQFQAGTLELHLAAGSDPAMQGHLQDMSGATGPATRAQHEPLAATLAAREGGACGSAVTPAAATAAAAVEIEGQAQAVQYLQQEAPPASAAGSAATSGFTPAQTPPPAATAAAAAAGAAVTAEAGAVAAADAVAALSTAGSTDEFITTEARLLELYLQPSTPWAEAQKLRQALAVLRELPAGDTRVKRFYTDWMWVQYTAQHAPADDPSALPGAVSALIQNALK